MLAAKTEGATRTKIVWVEYTGTVKSGAWFAAMALWEVYVSMAQH